MEINEEEEENKNLKELMEFKLYPNEKNIINKNILNNNNTDSHLSNKSEINLIKNSSNSKNEYRRPLIPSKNFLKVFLIK